MSLKDALDAGLAAVPGCRTICYVDMDSGLVLGSASRVRMKQEQLDQLGAAAALLRNPGLVALQRAFDAAGSGDGLGGLTIARHDELIMLVRSPSYADHALCYVCGTDVDPALIDRHVTNHKNSLAGLV